MRALIWPLNTSSAWAQTFTELAGTISEGAAPPSVRWFGLGYASHCVDEQDS